MKVCPQWAGCITLCSSELLGYQGFARWHACTPVWDFSVHYVLQDPILAAVPAFPPSCLYAFAKSWKLGCVKLHCARTCWGAFGDLRLCETLAGQKCCCHTHPLTPLSIHPHQRVSHPCPTIYVLCKYHMSQWCPSWAALCALRATTGTSTAPLLWCRAAPGGHAAPSAMAASTPMSVLSTLIPIKDSIKSP